MLGEVRGAALRLVQAREREEGAGLEEWLTQERWGQARTLSAAPPRCPLRLSQPTHLSQRLSRAER